MAVSPHKQLPVALDSIDVSAFATSVGSTMAKEEVRFAPVGNLVPEYYQGDLDVSISIDGGWDDAYLAGALSRFQNAGTLKPLLVGLQSGGAVGSRCTIGQVQILSWNPSVTRGQIPALTMGGKGRERLLGYIGGNNMFGSALAAGTHNQSAVNGGAIAASEAIVSQIHVLSLTGTSPTVDVTLESNASSSFSGSETTRITHTQLTAVGSQISSADITTTDAWQRHKVVIGGTSVACTLVLGFAIVPDTTQIT